MSHQMSGLHLPLRLSGFWEIQSTPHSNPNPRQHRRNFSMTPTPKTYVTPHTDEVLFLGFFTARGIGHSFLEGLSLSSHIFLVYATQRVVWLSFLFFCLLGTAGGDTRNPPKNERLRWATCGRTKGEPESNIQMRSGHAEGPRETLRTGSVVAATNFIRRVPGI